MTQADAAKEIDVSRTTMVAIEKGERRLKSTELIKLALVPTDALLVTLLGRDQWCNLLKCSFEQFINAVRKEEAEIEPFIL